MKPTWSFSNKIRYHIDNLFSSGPAAMIIGLSLVSIAIVILAGSLLYAFQLAPGAEEPFSWLEALWLSLIRTLGGGSAGGRESQISYRLVMLGLTFGGIFFTSALIGILTTGLNARLETLRKGRSVVIERDHVVILGWTGQIYSILSELILANSGGPRTCLVILADQEKTKMEDAIRQKLPHNRNVRIVCRTGNPLEMDDLRLTSLNTSKAIIILSPEHDNPDAEVIKTVLAITNHPQRRKEPYHIVAGVRSPKNYDITRVVGKGEVEWVRPGDMAARMIAQTCRQSGLSTIYTGLLDYGSDEIHFLPAGSLVGCTFAQALLNFPSSSLIGIKAPGQAPSLNPGMQQVLQPGDELVVLAPDEYHARIEPAPQGAVWEEFIMSTLPIPKKSERTLILGWNWRGKRVLEELDYYVSPGSTVLVAANEDLTDNLGRDCEDLRNQKVCFKRIDTADRSSLEGLELDQFDHIILLCYSDRLPAQEADACTMITLLHLRDLADQNGYRYSIVSEMIDIRNRKLAAVTRADDFIVSDRLVSLLMAQVAENRWINPVFSDLFNQGGSEIYLKPVEQYVSSSQGVNYYTVTAAALRKNEIAMGYKLAAFSHDAERSFGVVLNPGKAEEIQFSAGDRIIVLAEN